MENNIATKTSIRSLLDESANIKEFSRGYFKYLSELLQDLDCDSIASFMQELEDARRNGNTVYIIGNGGSAMTASHMANDLSFGSRGEDGELPFKAMALSDNAAVMTALANDCGYDSIFLRQLKVHYNPGDKLIAISASGNSPNIVAAAKWVKQKGGKVIGMVGFDGGRLKEIADVIIHVRSEKDEYGPVEDIHMIIEHLLYTWFWYYKRQRNL